MLPVVTLAAALMLLAGAGAGGAATSIDVQISSLVGSVTAGQTVGYHAAVLNSGGSTVTQASLVVDTALATSPAVGAAFVSASPSSALVTCGAGLSPAQMICTIAQLPSGQGFSVDFVFAEPSAATLLPDSIEARASVTVSAQTKGSANSNGTSTWYPPASEYPVSTAVLAASTSLVQTFARPGEHLRLPGTVLHADVALPSTFATAYYGIAAGAREVTDAAPLCDKCPAYFLDLALQYSTTAANPFSPTNPFTFVVSLDASGYPPGYKPVGIVHLGAQVPLCTTPPAVDINPSKMCLDAPPSKDKKTGVITASGRGYENGFIGFD
jgi:hypothetical protein